MSTIRGTRIETRGWQTWWLELLKQVTSCGERKADERPALCMLLERTGRRAREKNEVAESDSGPNLLRHPAATVAKLYLIPLVRIFNPPAS